MARWSEVNMPSLAVVKHVVMYTRQSSYGYGRSTPWSTHTYWQAMEEGCMTLQWWTRRDVLTLYKPLTLLKYTRNNVIRTSHHRSHRPLWLVCIGACMWGCYWLLTVDPIGSIANHSTIYLFSFSYPLKYNSGSSFSMVHCQELLTWHYNMHTVRTTL